MNDVICACPIFDRLDLTKIAITSLIDLGFTVLGVSDGDCSLDFFNKDYTYVYKKKESAINFCNTVNRLDECLKTGREWLYLFDSDTVHIPSVVKGMDILKNVLKFKDLGGMFLSPFIFGKEKFEDYNENLYLAKTAAIGGISWFLNRATALYLRSTVLSEDKRGFNGGWDGEVSRYISNFYITKNSYVEHIGNNSGHNFRHRESLQKNDIALNIDRIELESTLKKYFSNNTLKYTF
jgi:hypothetical protein